MSTKRRKTMEISVKIHVYCVVHLSIFPNKKIHEKKRKKVGNAASSNSQKVRHFKMQTTKDNNNELITTVNNLANCSYSPIKDTIS